MDHIFLTDETLNINSTSSYQLSMQAGVDGFSYSILDSGRNKYIALKHVPLTFEDMIHESYCKKITDIIDADEYLNCKYKSVRFMINTQQSTLVPETLFDKESLSSFFNFNHTLHEAETLHYNKLKNTDAFCIFALPFHLVETIYMRFANAKLFNQTSVFIDNNLIRYKAKGNKQKVFINISCTFFDIMITNGSHLHLYNNFAFKTNEECVYFIMYIFDQLNISPESTELITSGLTQNCVLHSKIKKFIKNIVFEKRDNSFLYSYVFNDIASGDFVNLLNLNKCE